MKIVVARKTDLKEIPDMVIRLDIAWKLFLPNSFGRIPNKGNDRDFMSLTNFLWNELGKFSGRLRNDLPEKLWIMVPDLDEAGFRYVERIASMWSDEVVQYQVPGDSSPVEKEAWISPTTDVFSDKSLFPEEEALTLNEPEGTTRYLMPLLGMGRAFMRTYWIGKDSTYSRLHSHSAVDEYYLVLSGQGTLRTGAKEVSVKPGTLISKPTGPDMTSQFIADRGEELKILDIEVWPDATRTAKDLVYYPDHNEVLLRGIGWSNSLPYESIMSARDLDENYDLGYTRNEDGSWSPKDVPGMKRREK